MKKCPVVCVFLVALFVSFQAAVTSADAAGKWVSVKPAKFPGRVCLEASGQEFTYYELGAEAPVEFTVSGPRRVKIITRYLYAEEDPEAAEYTVRVVRDGVALLRRAISTKASGATAVCEEPSRRVGRIRRLYLDVPKGSHTYRVYVVEESRRVAARVFRRVEVRRENQVSFAPSEYRAVCTLQFASGSLSTYYSFDAEQPLRFEVVGPTRVRVCTRLEFDHSMNGSQAYGVEVLQDGERMKGYQYHVRKMETVCYVERPEVLPGQRKCFTLAVPRGPHAYEVRMAGRSANRAAAKIYIPKADLEKGD